MMLSLMEAISQDRLAEFIAQEEARGVSPVRESEFGDTLATVIKTPRSEDQTSHSPSRDGSAET